MRYNSLYVPFEPPVEVQAAKLWLGREDWNKTFQLVLRLRGCMDVGQVFWELGSFKSPCNLQTSKAQIAKSKALLDISLSQCAPRNCFGSYYINSIFFFLFTKLSIYAYALQYNKLVAFLLQATAVQTKHLHITWTNKVHIFNNYQTGWYINLEIELKIGSKTYRTWK